MTTKAASQFLYITYIRSTPEKVWAALTDSRLTRQYWCEVEQECEWTAGAPWKMMIPDGRVADSGEVVEVDAPRKLVLRWQNEFMPELKAEGYSRMTYTLDPQGSSVKLSVLHEMDR